MPWFVSDVTPPDFSIALELLQKADEWSNMADPSINPEALATISRRFQERVQQGIFQLVVPLDTKIGASFSKRSD
jgi:damage-control phosphatase, subfamily III